MPQLKKRWYVPPPLSEEALHSLHGYPPILRQILYNRGFATHEAARLYLEAAPPPVSDPFYMVGIPEAVDRIEWAMRSNQRIAIYGDFDADGVTASALLVQALGLLGAHVQVYIPNRFDEGYGLNLEALDHLRSIGVDLVITVDCGIRSLDETEHAQKLGLDLIITDHHHPTKELPRAEAVINPKQTGDQYPEKDLAGVGLAWKLLEALLTRLREKRFLLHEDIKASDYYDLVAIGTVADLAPLLGENRFLVKQGLIALRKTRRQGLLSLMLGAGLTIHRLSATDIGYVIAPRLNAAGRLDSALEAFDLLTTNDVSKAAKLAQRLEIQNHERQQLTNSIHTYAEQIALEEDPAPYLLFAAHPEFNPGVVGLVASRLVDQYYRPTIIAQKGDDYTRGSCRSIPEFHITQALDECADLLEHHGGHAAAAGFTIRTERLPAFLERLKEISLRTLEAADLHPTLTADADIPLSELKPEILEYLDWLQPTGYGNHQATFISRGLKIKSARAVGKDGAHLKLVVTDGRLTYDAIAFRQGYWTGQLPGEIDILYHFELNEYNGRQSLQLNVHDLKPAGTPD